MEEWLTALLRLMFCMALIGILLGTDEQERFLPLMKLAVMLFILQWIFTITGS